MPLLHVLPPQFLLGGFRLSVLDAVLGVIFIYFDELRTAPCYRPAQLSTRPVLPPPEPNLTHAVKVGVVVSQCGKRC